MTRTDYVSSPRPITTETATGTVVPSALITALETVIPHAADPRDCLPLLASLEITSADGRLTFAATDRYTLGTFTMEWDGPDGVSALLPVGDAKRMVRHAKRARKAMREAPCLSLTFRPDVPEDASEHNHGIPMAAASILARNLGADVGEEDETFPDVSRDYSPFVKWRAIVPDYGTPDMREGLHWIGVNPANLARFSKVGSAARLTFGPVPTKPVVITADMEAGTFLGLLMPVRMPTE